MAGFWLWLHLLGVVVWIGGMFFALFCLRPAVADLQPQQRPSLMLGVLGRFFSWVFLAILLIWISGLTRMMQIGMANVPLSWHLMAAIGTLMTIIFLVIRLVHFKRAIDHVARADLPAAAQSLENVRSLVFINLMLGLVAMACAKLVF